jgi:hypothetical protein
VVSSVPSYGRLAKSDTRILVKCLRGRLLQCEFGGSCLNGIASLWARAQMNGHQLHSSSPIATRCQLGTMRCPTCMRRYVCTVMTTVCDNAYTANSAHDVDQLLFPPANLSSLTNCLVQSRLTIALTAFVQSASCGLLRHHPPYEDADVCNIFALSHGDGCGRWAG